MMLTKPIAVLAVAALVVLVAVPVATADNPNDTQYGNPATALPTETRPPPTEATPPAPPTETAPLTPPTVPTTEPTTTPAEKPAEENVASPETFTPPTVASEGTLPFTGMDLGVALAIGLATVAGGLILRRLGRTEG